MQVYKRGVWSFIKSLIIGVGGSVAIYFILPAFINNMVTVELIAIGFLLLMLFLTIFSENIKVEVEDETLRYYKRNKLKNEFHLPSCSIRIHTRTERGVLGTDNINMYITQHGVENEQEVLLDCSPLGSFKFEKLKAQIQQLVQPAPVALEAQPQTVQPQN